MCDVLTAILSLQTPLETLEPILREDIHKVIPSRSELA